MQPEFEFIYQNAEVKHISHYAAKTPLSLLFKKINVLCIDNFFLGKNSFILDIFNTKQIVC